MARSDGNSGRSIGLAKRAGRSAAWQVLGGGWRTGVNLIASFFLARALTPSDYGVYGIAILVQGMALAVGATSGISSGLIAKENLSEEDINAAYWISTFVKIMVFVFIQIVAHYVAVVFGKPMVEGVLRVTSLAVLLNILQHSSLPLLTREMEFRKLNIINAVGGIIQTVVALVCAMHYGLGVWSLVISFVIGTAVISVWINVSHPWSPRLVFCRPSMNYFGRYCVNGIGTEIFIYMKRNIDYLVVARVFGPATLGLYEFAYRIPHLIQTNITQPIERVIMSGFASLGGDKDKMFSGYIKTVQMFSVVAFPALGGLSVVADLAVPLMWGDQWLPIVSPLRVLCVAAVLIFIVQPCEAIFYCHDRPEIPFRIALVGFVWTAAVVTILGLRFGLMGVAFGMVLAIIPELYGVYIALSMLNKSLFGLIRYLYPMILSTSVCMISVLLFRYVIGVGNEGFVFLVECILLGAVVYVITMLALFMNTSRSIIALLLSVAGR